MKAVRNFISALLGGAVLALGTAASLIVKDELSIASALVFSMGFLAIAVFEFGLFTDNSSLLLSKKNGASQMATIIIAWLGNIIAAFIIGILMKPQLADAAKVIVTAKSNSEFLPLCIDALLCGALVYIAMHGYRKSGSGFTSCAILVAATFALSVCDLNFAPANALYIGAAYNTFSSYAKNIGSVLTHTLFAAFCNVVGALFFSVLNKIKNNELSVKRHHRHKHHRRHHSHSHSGEESAEKQN